MKQVVEKLLELLYPPKCVICEELLPIGMGVCKKCRKQLPFMGENVCMKCGKPISEHEEFCKDCVKHPHYFTQGVALWFYSPFVKKSLYRFKYNNKRIYGKYYGEELVMRYKTHVKRWKIDGIIPVPIHASKKRMRGYNQAEILAKELSKGFQIPIYPHFVKRVKKTIPQKELNDKERTKNVKNAFKLRQNSVKLKRVLLVDDIYTTGATVDEIAKVLLQAGVEHVYVMTICIGRGY